MALSLLRVFSAIHSTSSYKLARKITVQALGLLIVLGAAGSAASQQVGPPIIFVHGICDHPASWDQLRLSLTAYLNSNEKSLYPNPQVYIAVASGPARSSLVNFFDSNDALLQASSIPANARFFSIAFRDPNCPQCVPSAMDTTSVMQLSIAEKGDELAAIIAAVKRITSTPKAILIAHSMGGLDSRSYLENLGTQSSHKVGSDSDVVEVTTIDTPHMGSPAADLSSIASFVSNDYFGQCLIHSSEDMTELNIGSSVLQDLNYGSTAASALPRNVSFDSIVNYVPSNLLPTSVYDYVGSFCSGFGQSSDNDGVVCKSSENIANALRSYPPNEPFPHVSSSSTPFSGTCPSGLGGTDLPLLLHQLGCVGAQQSTQSQVEVDVINNLLQKSIDVEPQTVTITSGQTQQFTAAFNNATPVVNWTLLEDPSSSAINEYGNFQANSLGTFHVVALDQATGKLFGIATVQVKNPVAVGITASVTQTTIGVPITLTASVQSIGNTATGYIIFYDGTTALSQSVALNTSGIASIIISSLTQGTHSVTAKYGGDSNFSVATSSPVSITIGNISPKITVSPQNGAIGITTFAKSGTGFTPNGAITHTATWPDGTKSILNGYADATGGFSYTVTYSSVTGTYYETDKDNTTGQTSNTVSWTVLPVVANDFSLTASPNSQTVLQSGSVSYNIATATTSGTEQTVSFGTSNLPSGLSASFSPTSVTTGLQSTLTISANSSTQIGTYTFTIAAASSYTTHTYQLSVTVAQAQTGPVMTVTPSIVRFNDQTVGSISSPQTVVLRNSGTGQLIVTGVGLASGNADYALDLSKFSSPLILNQGVTFTVPVYFEPTAVGSRPGQIIIYDNAPGSPQVVSLTGNGLSSQPSTGTITVNATLNGIALPALYGFQYSVTGPTQITGYDSNSFSVVPGSYSITFLGTPSYFTLSSITTSATQSVVAGGTTTFTLNFTAPNDFYGPTFMQPPGGGFTPQIVPAGSTATYYVDVAAVPNSASTPITLSIVGAPGNTNPAFTPQPMYSGTGGTLKIGTTAGQTPSGVYALTVTGTNSSGVTHVGNSSTLAVTAPPGFPVQLISQNSSEVQGNSGGFVTDKPMSGDGRFVAFSSTSTNLVPGITSGHQEIYVRDIQSGITSLASLSTSGVPADSDSCCGRMSTNGQFVVFSSFADNLYPGSVLNSASGVYVRDLTQNATEREDLAPDGTSANGSSNGGAISADGRFVAFISNATNLINGVSGTQLYVRDRKLAKTILVSAAIDGSPANGSISSLSISADGHFVAFISNATNLVSQNTSGLFQAYARDVFTGATDLVSISPDGIPANSYVFDDNGSAPPGMSSDGRYIAFSSYATNLVPQPTDGTNFHNFIFDRQTQQISLVDVDSVGTPLSGTGYLHPSMSLDGRFVGFYGFGQVLVRDTVENQTAVVSLGSNGQPGNNATWGWNIGLGGAGIAFASTATNLIANDSNNTVDAFVASNPFVGSTSLKSINMAAPSTSGGGTVTGTVILTAAAPANGAVVSVWSNNAAVQPPALVTIHAGSTSAQFSINTSVVTSETITTVMAAYNGGSGVSVLTLEPASELTVSPTSFDFGNQLVAATSPAQPFTLTNSGTAPLTINSIQMSTGQAFSIIANTCQSSLSPGRVVLRLGNVQTGP